MTDTAKVGLRGEQFAARFLRDNGCRVLSAGFETPGGAELDIVALDGGTLCFTEVKTRSSHGMFPPSDAVDADKQRNMETAARAYIRVLESVRQTFTYTRVRFDVVEVILLDLRLAEINRIENAFGSDSFVNG